MAKKNPKFLIILAAIVFTGCGTKTVNTYDALTIDILKNYPKKEISLQSVADVEYVALETTDDVLLGDDCRLTYISDNYIVVWEALNGISVFNRNGKAVTHISNRGGGPGEHYIIRGIVFDENNEEVFVLDHQSFYEIHVHSLTGKYKRTLKYSEDLKNIKIYDFDDETLLVYDETGLLPGLDNISHELQKTPYMFLSKKDGSIVSTLNITLPVRLPYNVIGAVNIDGQSMRNTSFIIYPSIFTVKNGDNFVIADVSSDTIYMLTKDKELTPFINRTPSVHSSSVIKTLTACLLTDNFMLLDKRIFNFSDHNIINNTVYNPVLLMYEFESGLTSEVKFVDDDFPAKTWNPGGYRGSRVSSPQKNVAASLFQMSSLYETYERKELRGDLEKLVATLDEYANPIIMIVKFK